MNMFNYIVVSEEQFATVPDDVKNMFIVTALEKPDGDETLKGYLLQNRGDISSYEFAYTARARFTALETARLAWWDWLAGTGWYAAP